MKFCLVVLIPLFLFFNILSVNAQDSSQPCKVGDGNLVGKYIGECKNGYANGKGEATGIHHYIGTFKYGLPNGTGIYYYSDSVYYSGNFQDGIKEGKGEFHYSRKGLPDSLVKGYWSADVFRGKQYVTNKISGTQYFDNVEINASKEIGHILTIEITTTSGSPNGARASAGGSPGFGLTLSDLISTNGGLITKTSSFASSEKSTVTYNISNFPAQLFATLSNGETFNLELYKAAYYTVRLYKNK